VSTLRERFVAAAPDAPVEERPVTARGGTEPPSILGVLAAPPLTAPAGAAVALAAARRARAPAALACLWTPGAAAGRADRPAPLPARGPVLPGSRRLAAALDARGHETAAAGRLVLVRLAEEDTAAAAEAVRVLAAAGGAAAALALGARSEAFDRVLAGHDALVLWPDPGAPAPLADLALASLRALGPPALSVTGGLGARSRALTLAGLAAPATATTAVRELLVPRPAAVDTT
jgi:hypothetical protein